jgi:hypothetical protein
MLAKLNKLSSKWATLIITIIGFAVYFTGLTSPFRNDDMTQIVNNLPVHSLANIKLFFEGGTIYLGKGIAPLAGIYYRPLQTVYFSTLYTIFGAHSFIFHLFQLLIYIASALILYLVFKYSFKPALALVLALIFLVHPINSQVAFAIWSTQEVLFFFFGILAFWLLLRFQSFRSLIPVAACLFLSLLSKETAVAFIIMALLYLFWFNRDRLYAFIGIMVVPVCLYLALRIYAVGLNTHEYVAPISNLNLVGRLYTAPSIMLFYITKFIFPWKLATAYYWVYPTFSFRHVLLPLLIDIAVVGVFVYLGFALRRRIKKANFYTYLFFAAWAAVGILLHLQIIPIDMTASETWFYFPMVGVLGMVGVILGAYKVRPKWVLTIALILICLLGVRTAIRGLDWSNPITLTYKNIAASSEDFVAYNDIANSLNNQGHYQKAKAYELDSISIYPTYFGYYNLGVIQVELRDFSDAISAYNNALKYGNDVIIYENLGELSILYGNPTSDGQLFTNALGRFPNDFKLWTYLAIIEDKYDANAKAQIYIEKAASLGPVSQFIYNKIMNNQPFTLSLPDLGKEVQIQ